jgi:anaerobic magnesium-protoporphyrin IX monomethyl ester cyclase
VNELDTLPFPARDMLPVSRYLIPPGYIRFHFLNRVMSILTSRGCPSKCTFCNSSSIFHNRIRRRSVENVMKEIAYLVDCYRLDGIYFHDETFTINYEWVKNLCQELKPLNLRWGCQTRVNLVSDELLKIMQSAGCIQIDFGIESASKRVLKSIKKGTTPEQAIIALELARRNNIKSFASFMVGLPGETEDDLMENVNFLKKVKPDYTYFNLYTPFPGTEAAESAIKEGRLSKDFFNRDYDMLLETSQLVNLSAVPTDIIIKYHRKLRNMVFLKNYVGVLTRNNLFIIFEALLAFLLSPSVLVKSLIEFMATRNAEKLIFMIFSNYQKKKSRKGR